MINDTLIWFLLLPVLGAVAIWWFTGHKVENLAPAGIYVVACCVVIFLCFFISRGVATSDTEIWNGQVVSKNREHGSYKRPYDCNCRSVERCSGTGSTRSCTSDRVCDTCWEDRYTVTWSCNTTIGTFTIQHLDRTTRLVYNEPDPARYTTIKIGDPASKQNMYTNYVQAVPDSLFTRASRGLQQQFAGLIPAYPDSVYDFYRIDRFLTPGHATSDAAQWNAGISELLKTRGPTKQVNVIVVVAKTADPNYAYALRDAWDGANKNDVVLVIGSSQWPKIDFVEVISWTKRELFKTQLRDEVMAIGSIEREPILKILAHQIDTNFERRRMREFEYLKAEIDPPANLLVFLFIVISSAAVGLIYFLNGKAWRRASPSLNGNRRKIR